MAEKKVELFEENLDKVVGGTGGESDNNNGADNNAGDNGGEDNGGDGGTPTQTTSEPPVTPTANPGGPNYNNDNRGGKQMNVQMGKNINSSKSNSMS